MEEKLRIGIIGKAQGLKGEIRIYPTTNVFSDLLDLKNVFVKKENENIYKAFTIKSARISKDFCVVKFEEIEDRTQAKFLTGKEVYVDRKDAPKLSKDEFYYKDIIGCEVFSDDGRNLGTIKEIYETGANDVYRVVGEKEILIPAIKDVVQKVDISHKKIKVHLLKGLEDINN